MRLIYLTILILTISSCHRIVIDNTSEKTFRDSFRKIHSTLDRDDQIKFDIACLVIFSQETKIDDINSFDIHNLQIRADFRNLYANKTARDIINQADDIMDSNQNLKLQMEMMEITIKVKELGVLDK